MLVNKTNGKRRKLFHFSDLIKNFEFSAYYKHKMDGHSGWMYRIHEKNGVDMNEAIERITNSYDNTEFLKGHAQYAPEIKFTYLFVAK